VAVTSNETAPPTRHASTERAGWIRSSPDQVLCYRPYAVAPGRNHRRSEFKTKRRAPGGAVCAQPASGDISGISSTCLVGEASRCLRPRRSTPQGSWHLRRSGSVPSGAPWRIAGSTSPGSSFRPLPGEPSHRRPTSSANSARRAQSRPPSALKTAPLGVFVRRI
jgi:hypothetical protein